MGFSHVISLVTQVGHDGHQKDTKHIIEFLEYFQTIYSPQTSYVGKNFLSSSAERLTRAVAAVGVYGNGG